MVVYIDQNKLVIIKEPKTISFDFSKEVDHSLKHGINYIIKRNEFFAECSIKNKISQLWAKYEHENDVHEHGKHSNE